MAKFHKMNKMGNAYCGRRARMNRSGYRFYGSEEWATVDCENCLAKRAKRIAAKRAAINTNREPKT